jgi:hypothetical protein
MMRRRTKRMAEGGEAKSRNFMDLGLGALGGIIPMIASGEMGRVLGSDRGEQFSDEEKNKLRAMVIAQGGNPAAAGMKKGGAVKKMAIGGAVKKTYSGGIAASKRADGCATRGKTKGRMV